MNSASPRARSERRRHHAAWTGVCLLGLAACLAMGAHARAQQNETAPTAQEPPAAPPVQKVDLAEFPKGWKFISAENGSALSATWKVTRDSAEDEPYLACEGMPYGYLTTEKTHQDFEFGFEWRFPDDPNGNSGVLIHTSQTAPKNNQFWPSSIQVQLHGPNTGSIFPLGDAMSANNLQVRDQMLTPKQWHRCVIRSHEGAISVTIDDKPMGEVTGCAPKAGNIALQSEGSLVHFRRIWIRELKPAAKPEPKPQQSASSPQ